MHYEGQFSCPSGLNFVSLNCNTLWLFAVVSELGVSWPATAACDSLLYNVGVAALSHVSNHRTANRCFEYRMFSRFFVHKIVDLLLTLEFLSRGPVLSVGCKARIVRKNHWENHRKFLVNILRKVRLRSVACMFRARTRTRTILCTELSEVLTYGNYL